MTALDSAPEATGTGVDASALGVAMARVRETARKQPLFTDPYVRALVDAAAAPLDAAPQASDDYAAARTKWFDDFFLTAGSAGLSQVVILNAGLDTRAWRLPWLSDAVIYEVDRAAMLGFKADVLTGTAGAPTARYVPVAADLRDDWPHALAAAGFDHNEPTAWAIEGLFPVVPDHMQDHLLDRIDLYSARGSRIAVETHADGPDVRCWLCARHWEVNSTVAPDLMDRYHRDPLDEPAASGVFIDGRKL